MFLLLPLLLLPPTSPSSSCCCACCCYYCSRCCSCCCHSSSFRLLVQPRRRRRGGRQQAEGAGRERVAALVLDARPRPTVTLADAPSSPLLKTPTKARGGCSRMTVSPTARCVTLVIDRLSTLESDAMQVTHGTEEMVQPLSNPPTSHLFGCAASRVGAFLL